MSQSRYERFATDKTCMILLIILMFVVGVTISQLVFNIDYSEIARNAEGKLTKEQQAENKANLAKAYEQAKAAKINKITDVQLHGPILKVISIQLSNKCLADIRFHLNTTCPTYKELAEYDTTNQKYVGKFIEKNGIFQRDKPRILNPSITIKNVQNYIICVDCPFDIFRLSKQITLTNNHFNFTKDTDRKVINGTTFQYKDRGEENCAYVLLYYTPELLEDTIEYLKSGCTETDFENKIVIQKELTKHDISTTKAYKYQKWLEAAKKVKGINCLKSDKC